MDAATKPGQVIFLNGTSSSGKTTLARALQEALPRGLSSSVRRPICQSAAGGRSLNDQAALAPVVHRLSSRASTPHAAAVALAGNNIIVDHVLQDTSWVASCVRAFRGIETLFIAVRCPLDELERRENERGDRIKGLARSQYDGIHSCGIYDLELGHVSRVAGGMRGAGARLPGLPRAADGL